MNNSGETPLRDFLISDNSFGFGLSKVADQNILRLAIKHAPEDAIDLLKKVNSADERISELFNKISEEKNG